MGAGAGAEGLSNSHGQPQEPGHIPGEAPLSLRGGYVGAAACTCEHGWARAGGRLFDASPRAAARHTQVLSKRLKQLGQVPLPLCAQGHISGVQYGTSGQGTAVAGDGAAAAAIAPNVNMSARQLLAASHAEGEVVRPVTMHGAEALQRNIYEERGWTKALQEPAEALEEQDRSSRAGQFTDQVRLIRREGATSATQ